MPVSINSISLLSWMQSLAFLHRNNTLYAFCRAWVYRCHTKRLDSAVFPRIKINIFTDQSISEMSLARLNTYIETVQPHVILAQRSRQKMRPYRRVLVVFFPLPHADCNFHWKPNFQPKRFAGVSDEWIQRSYSSCSIAVLFIIEWAQQVSHYCMQRKQWIAVNVLYDRIDYYNISHVVSTVESSHMCVRVCDMHTCYEIPIWLICAHHLDRKKNTEEMKNQSNDFYGVNYVLAKLIFADQTLKISHVYYELFCS